LKVNIQFDSAYLAVAGGHL